MAMGGVRHIADIKADDMSREGAGVIGLQAGSNKGASQAGEEQVFLTRFNTIFGLYVIQC